MAHSLQMMVLIMQRLNSTANEEVYQAWINFIYSPVKAIGLRYLNISMVNVIPLLVIATKRQPCWLNGEIQLLIM